MNIVIVAGGLGSRLSPLTDFIPKFLVNIGKNTGYVEQVRQWSNHPQFNLPHKGTITVIVHSKYVGLVTAYHKMYFPALDLIVKTVDEANGSAHAILSSCDHLIGKPVIFQWCDVMPAERFDLTNICQENENIIFTNYDHNNRYGVQQVYGGGVVPVLRTDGAGGIFGMYYVQDFSTNKTYENGQDFVEILPQFGVIADVGISKIVDWGDMPKLEQLYKRDDGAREFNSVEVLGDFVVKKALNQQGEKLIAREVDWYLNIGKDAVDVSVPEVWTQTGNKSFIMRKVDGVPVFKAWKNFTSAQRVACLNSIFVELGNLHSGATRVVGRDTVLRDVKIEACSKLINRYREIKGVVDAFGEVHIVNGVRITETDPEVTIHRLYARLHEIYAGVTEYQPIHGDLQMSNSMVDPTSGKITFIDPRGYFGETDFIGLPDYDIAKVYYSLSGYDLFNYSRSFHISSFVNGELNFEIPKPDLTGCDSIMAEHFWCQHQLWLAVIWIGLAGYIKNDPVKSLCAHYHGLSIAKRVMNGTFDQFNP